MKVNIVIGMLGLIAGLLIAMVAGTAEKPAFAQAISRDGAMIAVPTNYNNQQEDLLWVLDTKNEALSCYRYQNKMIELIGTREIKWDLQIREFIYGGQHKSVSDIEKLVTKANKQRGK